MEPSEPLETAANFEADRLAANWLAALADLPVLAYECQAPLAGHFVQVSAGTVALADYPAAALLAGERTYADLIWPEDRPVVQAALAAAQAEARPYRCQYRLQTAGGEARWVVDTGRFLSPPSPARRQGVIVLLPPPTAADLALVQAERNRLARELHDSVTQSLYSVTLFAEAGRHLAAGGAAARASQYFDDVLATSRQALRELRLLVHRLRPSILAEAGLARALQQRLNAVEGRTGVEHSLQVSSGLQLDAEQEEVLYHIAQEALNNALKHAAARVVSVTLLQTAVDVQLVVTDDGQGFDMDQAIDGGGLGLISMQERAAGLGGQVTLATAPEAGTTVSVSLPLAAAGPAEG